MSKAFLCILDGLGLGKHDKGDAVFHAHAPYLHGLMEHFPMAKLKTDGNTVGLPSFQTGGSEVGHITIGAGRPVKNLLTIIDDQIESGEFFKNPVLQDLFKKAKEKGRIHFLGMTSDGGIHSFQSHLYGLQKMAKQYDIPQIYLHCLADGRDVGERTLKKYLEEVEEQKIGTIATIGGRFYGMDRDQNWERIKAYYDAMTIAGSVISEKSWPEEVDNYYSSTTTSDYYLPPVSFSEAGKIRPDDIVIFWNYRVDRARQISWALVSHDFSAFPGIREMPPQDFFPVRIPADNLGAFGNYYPFAKTPFSFGAQEIPNTLGEVVSKAGKTQLRISETEKFNHVTFYFSGEKKDAFLGEDRILVPSPKCNSYAEKPEMSAREQTEKLLAALEEKEYDLIVQNFANPDLVGHSGDLEATKIAVSVVSECLANLIPKMQEKGYTTLIIADHGNADEMILPNGEVSASHSKNLVPAILIFPSHTGEIRDFGTLADIAPTLLDILKLSIPKEMTGNSLITPTLMSI
ncbi:MAG: 2,3-bisphosphoglycerate-independent phosphoglycerate mutase [Candidatus Peregrinibacteria bacterium]